MFLTVLLSFFTSALICSAAPTLENEHCGKPGEKEGATLQGNWNAETYSPGTVATFTCVNGYIRDGPIRMACIEGSWLDISRGQCKILGYCSKPQQSHENGELEGQWNDETFPPGKVATYICRHGYSQTSPIKKACIDGEWITISKGQCLEDIVCYKETVKNGIVRYTKETYRDGETVTLTCNEGYRIEHKPEEPRTCTAHGWSPPLNCVNKKCIQPNPQNGYIKDEYRFPISPDSYYNSIYYYCDSGFLSQTRNYYGTTTCTKTGWNPEPKCYKKCDVPPSDSINAHITQTWSKIYIEGDKLRFQCYRDHKTSNGQTSGEIECLPDGKFYGEKCSKTCQKPSLFNVEHKTNEDVFDVGAYFIYKCKEGFISSNNKVEGNSECGSGGWQPKPECRGIFCKLKENVGSEINEITLPFGKVVHFKCPENRTLVGSSSVQCFHYGWSSSLPICRDETNEESSPFLDLTEPKESKCPIPAPSNARVIEQKLEYFNGDEIEIECNLGYQLYGSEKGLCKDGKWQSPPWCIELTRCLRNPPQISNGKISEESVADRYYSGSTVKYICADGYHIIGSDESKCIDGKWLPAPTCEGNSCGKPQRILNGRAEGSSRDYKHRERVVYVCVKGYKLSQADPASCNLGKWKGVPQCIDSSCGRPPVTITNGVLKEVQRKVTYFSGERATYECSRGYTMGQNENYITCENSVWTELPVCREIGQICGAPPVVKFGDITEIKQKTYQSDSSVIYKCANFYKLEGKQEITCKDGEWEKEPVCRVPCTVTENHMQQNNIEFRYKRGEEKNKKLYSEHFDYMSFQCKRGYQISDENLLRIQCLEGVLKYPRCLKEGSCVLQQTDMAINNIHYNKSTEIENGQTIEFECEEGMVSENDLRATCKNNQIKYPKCSTGRSCPPPDFSNAIISPKKQDGYESGSSVNFKCEDTFVLSGHTNVKCENGQWDELPQCLKPCTIDPSSLERNHIELLPTESTPEILKHGTELSVKCKANFKHQASLKALCYDGVMKYPRCFSGGTCRIIQKDLDENNLELDERHENEVFYEEGETVNFKCKTGYKNLRGLTGTCTKSKKQPAEYILTYPTCEQESAV